MKTILAAIDFSAASHNAAIYATELAKAFNARLIIFHAYLPIPVPLTEALVAVVPDDPEPFIAQRLNDEIEELDPECLVEMDAKFLKGRASEAIKAVALRYKADLVVVGMKKEHHDVRRLFGSTVTALIGKTTVPLLVVPEEARFQLVWQRCQRDLAHDDQRIHFHVQPPDAGCRRDRRCGHEPLRPRQVGVYVQRALPGRERPKQVSALQLPDWRLQFSRLCLGLA